MIPVCNVDKKEKLYRIGKAKESRIVSNDLNMYFVDSLYFSTRKALHMTFISKEPNFLDYIMYVGRAKKNLHTHTFWVRYATIMAYCVILT